MYISVSSGHQNFLAQKVATFDELCEWMLKSNYSLGTFTNGNRTLEKFISASAIGLDFDDGMTLEQALILAKPYKHVIAISRNHQKIKHPGESSEKPACDRFRVILFLSQPVKSVEAYSATWHKLAQNWPGCDPQCKDASRYYFPSPQIISVSREGLTIEPETEPLKAIVPAPQPTTTKGSLGVETMRFLTEGANPGTWNGKLYTAARDLYQQGYSHEDALIRFKQMVNPYFSGTLDSKDLTTIASAFQKEPKHPARLQDRAFTLQKWDTINAENTQKTWVVDLLMSVGGTTVLGADPKSGKSTLARQLAMSVLEGTPFLGQKTKQGPVIWYALEEQIEDLQDGFRRLGLKPGADLSIHIGPATTKRTVEDLSCDLYEVKPALVVIDTLFDILNVANENSYNEVRTEMARFSNVARATGTHILFIHHTNKGGHDKSGKSFKRRGTSAMMGSTAVLSKPDTLMVMEQDEAQRYLTVRGRGTVYWYYREMLFDRETLTYVLGREEEF